MGSISIRHNNVNIHAFKAMCCSMCMFGRCSVG